MDVRTRSKYDGVPYHDIIWAWAPGNTTRGISGKTFKVTDETSLAVSGLIFLVSKRIAIWLENSYHDCDREGEKQRETYK